MPATTFLKPHVLSSEENAKYPDANQIGEGSVMVRCSIVGNMKRSNWRHVYMWANKGLFMKRVQSSQRIGGR